MSLPPALLAAEPHSDLPTAGQFTAVAAVVQGPPPRLDLNGRCHHALKLVRRFDHLKMRTRPHACVRRILAEDILGLRVLARCLML